MEVKPAERYILLKDREDKEQFKPFWVLYRNKTYILVRYLIESLEELQEFFKDFDYDNKKLIGFEYK